MLARRVQALGRLRHGLVLAGLVALSACSSSSGLNPFGGESAPATPQPPVATQQPSGPVIGDGNVRVAMLLPLTSPQGAAQATAMRNAAEMAVDLFRTVENPNQRVQILVKDDKGTTQGAQDAARQALAEGAEIILGPLFAPAVSGAAEVARPSGRPIIGFSTDTSVASRGVYLLSFTPQADVERVVGFAASRGKRSFAALIPNTAYGNVVATAFQQAVGNVGGRLVILERYQPGPGLAAAAQRVGAAISQADALFVPESADGIGPAMQALTAAGVAPGRVQILGTSLWQDARTYRVPGLNGAWFPAPNTAGYAAFAQRYRQRFNADPTVIAPNAYDAVALVSALARTQGANRFAETVLTNPSGFAGQYGLFRFRADGTSERALAVLQIGNGATQVVSPAPDRFNAAAGG
jgi:ABC-type branched-subunit amino acid transport system substrate-binding protein